MLNKRLLVGVVLGFLAGYLLIAQEWAHKREDPRVRAPVVQVSNHGLEARIQNLERAVVENVAARSFINNAEMLRRPGPSMAVPLGVSTARKCDPSVQATPEALKRFAKSQDAEDMFLYNSYFHGLCGGRYIEMGALDGVTYSNSHMFNRGLGWKGLLIEGDPRNFAALHKNRQNELAVVHSAVCKEEAVIHYMPGSKTRGGGAVAGIWEFAAKKFRDVWWPGKGPADGIAVTCKPLQKIIDNNFGKDKPFYADFFSLDIEGAELQALESLNFSRTSFGIIFAEGDSSNVRKNLAVRTFLEEKGYIFLLNHLRSSWFVNPRFHEIYEKVIHIA